MINFFICISACLFFVDIWSWTWSYKKIYQPDDHSLLQTRTHFELSELPAFNQLIFSWNALRPKKGYFRFYVQVKTCKGGWSDSYKMLEWGNGVQKSYLHKHEHKPSFYHVRLEMPKKKFADAFRIIVEAHEGAILQDLKMVHVSLSELGSFKPEMHQKIDFKSVYIKNVPKISQMAIRHEDNWRICSPTSLAMLLGYLKKDYVHPLDVAKKSYDNGLAVYGSWPFNTAHAFELAPAQFFKVERLTSFQHLYTLLQQGSPVVVSIRGYIPGAAKVYENGHLILVVGWDKRTKSVIVHDPAFDKHKKVLRKYPIKDFLKAWERSHRLAYVAEIG